MAVVITACAVLGAYVLKATELHRAADRNDVMAIQASLANGSRVDAPRSVPLNGARQRWTPLMYAAASGSLDAARQLLMAGANPNAQDGLGRSPLIIVLQESPRSTRPALIELLISNGASVDVRTTHARTPLHVSVEGEGDAAALALLRGGAHACALDADGLTALELATRGGRATERLLRALSEAERACGCGAR
jgi:uncharacterized protein